MKKRLRRHRTERPRKLVSEGITKKKKASREIASLKSTFKKKYSLNTPKKKKTFFIGLVLLLVSAFLFFLYTRAGKQKFNLAITDFSSVDYNETLRKDKPTSPLCGCLFESVPHDGILIPAKYCKITNNQKELPLHNFLITCPDQNKIGPIEGYSYDAKVYRSNNSRYAELNLSELCALIEKDSLGNPYQDLNNNLFNSIITSNSIEVYSCLDHTITSFIGSVKGRTIFNKSYDKFTGKVSSVEILNTDSLQQDEEVNKLPALDVNSKKVYIRWVDSLQMLTPKGDTKTYDTLHEKTDRRLDRNKHRLKAKDIAVNIAVIEPKNNLRISIMPWSENYFAKWASEYYSQFEDGQRIMFYGHIPFIDMNTGEIGRDVRPFKTPAFVNRSADVKLNFENLQEDSIYNALYRYMSKNQGYNLGYDSNDYRRVGKTDISKGIKDSAAFFKKLDYIRNTENSNARELEVKMKELMGMVDTSKFEKIEGDTLMLNGKEEYFRYPPLHKERGASFYVQFESIKFNGCKGTVQVNGKPFQLNNQVIEIYDLKNIVYGYPALFCSFSDPSKEVILKGSGKIKIDGESTKENFFEKRSVLIISTIVSLFGFIITIIQLMANKKDPDTDKSSV